MRWHDYIPTNVSSNFFSVKERKEKKRKKKKMLPCDNTRERVVAIFFSGNILQIFHNIIAIEKKMKKKILRKMVLRSL